MTGESPFKELPGGGREFICTGCGCLVVQLIPDFDFPVCVTCRWFDERPQIPAAIKARFSGGGNA